MQYAVNTQSTLVTPDGDVLADGGYDLEGGQLAEHFNTATLGVQGPTSKREVFLEEFADRIKPRTSDTHYLTVKDLGSDDKYAMALLRAVDAPGGDCDFAFKDCVHSSVSRVGLGRRGQIKRVALAEAYRHVRRNDGPLGLERFMVEVTPRVFAAIADAVHNSDGGLLAVVDGRVALVIFADALISNIAQPRRPSRYDNPNRGLVVVDGMTDVVIARYADALNDAISSKDLVLPQGHSFSRTMEEVMEKFFYEGCLNDLSRPVEQILARHPGPDRMPFIVNLEMWPPQEDFGNDGTTRTFISTVEELSRLVQQGYSLQDAIGQVELLRMIHGQLHEFRPLSLEALIRQQSAEEGGEFDADDEISLEDQARRSFGAHATDDLVENVTVLFNCLVDQAGEGQLGASLTYHNGKDVLVYVHYLDGILHFFLDVVGSLGGRPIQVHQDEQAIANVLATEKYVATTTVFNAVVRYAELDPFVNAGLLSTTSAQLLGTPIPVDDKENVESDNPREALVRAVADEKEFGSDFREAVRASGLDDDALPKVLALRKSLVEQAGARRLGQTLYSALGKDGADATRINSILHAFLDVVGSLGGRRIQVHQDEQAIANVLSATNDDEATCIFNAVVRYAELDPFVNAGLLSTTSAQLLGTPIPVDDKENIESDNPREALVRAVADEKKFVGDLREAVRASGLNDDALPKVLALRKSLVEQASARQLGSTVHSTSCKDGAHVTRIDIVLHAFLDVVGSLGGRPIQVHQDEQAIASVLATEEYVANDATTNFNAVVRRANLKPFEDAGLLSATSVEVLGELDVVKDLAKSDNPRETLVCAVRKKKPTKKRRPPGELDGVTNDIDLEEPRMTRGGQTTADPAPLIA